MSGELVLGGAQLGLNYGVTKKHRYFSEKNSAKILETASILGIRMVDIAFDYGNIFKLINDINPGLDVISKLNIFNKEFPYLDLKRHNKIKCLK